MNYERKHPKLLNYRKNVENVSYIIESLQCFLLIIMTVVILVPKHDALHNKLNSAIQEVSNYYGMLEEREKQALRSAMIEERSHFCTLFTLLKPVMV